MLSFIVPARSLRDITMECLSSIFTATVQLGLAPQTEYILIDDASDRADAITELFADFRRSTGARARIFRFARNQHYTGSFALGLSRASGENVFFISNDIFVTPAWLRTLLAVAALDRSIGIVRGTAQIVDSHPEHEVRPPFEDNGAEDYTAFSDYISRLRGLSHTDDRVLSGDAVLIRRALIDRIGVLDRQFFGYFGDPDYGLRARRAGFRLVCAKGAWLKHHGQGHIKAENIFRGVHIDELNARRRTLVLAAYERFRAKWGPTLLPEVFMNWQSVDVDALLRAPRPEGFDFVAPVGEEPGLLQEL